MTSLVTKDTEKKQDGVFRKSEALRIEMYKLTKGSILWGTEIPFHFTLIKKSVEDVSIYKKTEYNFKMKSDLYTSFRPKYRFVNLATLLFKMELFKTAGYNGDKLDNENFLNEWKDYLYDNGSIENSCTVFNNLVGGSNNKYVSNFTPRGPSSINGYSPGNYLFPRFLNYENGMIMNLNKKFVFHIMGITKFAFFANVEILQTWFKKFTEYLVDTILKINKLENIENRILYKTIIETQNDDEMKWKCITGVRWLDSEKQILIAKLIPKSNTLKLKF